jgi:hypothetical protein
VTLIGRVNRTNTSICQVHETRHDLHWCCASQSVHRQASVARLSFCKRVKGMQRILLLPQWSWHNRRVP